MMRILYKIMVKLMHNYSKSEFELHKYPSQTRCVCQYRRLVFIQNNSRQWIYISTLTLMKNVVKCNTWYELQNPVNHRVFERKLCSMPFSRGHICLGVTHCCLQIPSPRKRRGSLFGGGSWPPVCLCS